MNIFPFKNQSILKLMSNLKKKFETIYDERVYFLLNMPWSKVISFERKFTVIICVVGHGILLVRTESSVITKKTFAMFIFSTCFHNGYYKYNAYIYACMHNVYLMLFNGHIRIKVSKRQILCVSPSIIVCVWLCLYISYLL